MEGNTMNPGPLMEMIVGFWASKALAAAVDLDVFTHLSASGGATVEDASRDLKMEPRPAELLLTACASVGLLTKAGGRYHNSALAEEYLVRNKLQYIGDFVRFMDQREYPAWMRLTDALRTNRPATWDPDSRNNAYDVEDPQLAEEFHAAMYSLSASSGTALAGAYDFSGVNRILDVGGGTGVYDIVLCRAYPNLAATVYDLPVVSALAERQIARMGLTDRIDVVPGSFLVDEDLPSGHDAALLAGVLHNWDPRTCKEIVRKVFRALEPGGAVLVSELFVNDEKTGPAPAALMSLNMLVETEGGQNYSLGEVTAWLTEAGFADVHLVEFDAGGASGVLVGTKTA
ncbi:methyltransferase [Micromonospora craniellae]|uniref:Methyltransferase domain-containing protein n=1 Tax=Micromonospora craniellae TaxID=2294034 RepID=A0A372FY29_9ACTN|nr:methyltransferase [Micromonospora craniellae]RFS45643.1 methyltransferase domain-containing protein [Micromonospora craniellae]